VATTLEMALIPLSVIDFVLEGLLGSTMDGSLKVGTG
jgi:hypothetical protein